MYQSTFHRSKEPDEGIGHCHFHPNEITVGVCPLCLHERLLTLASLKQSHYNKHISQQHFTTAKFLGHKTSSIFYRDCDDDSGSNSSSQEDSFISIKFEEHGAAFCDKEYKTDSNESLKKIKMDSSEQRGNMKLLNLLLESDVNKISNTNTNVKESAKSQGGTHSWRKRIVLMIDQIIWKNVSNTSTVH